MDVLQGALAFAVAMIVFSTLVTGIVEVILRATRMRPQLLIEAMGHYVEQYLLREMRRRNIQVLDKGDIEKFKKQIVGALVGNPAKTELPGIDENGNPTDPKAINRSSAVEDLSTYAFLQRLAKSKAGQELVETYENMKPNGRQELQFFLQDALRTFERYIATVNERFRIRSQWYALIVALLVALGFNISAGRLFTELMNDTPLQERLIIEAQSYADENLQRAAELNAQLTPLEGVSAGVGPQGDEPAATHQGSETAGAAATHTQTVEDLLERASMLQERSEYLLLKSGLPVGPKYFPYNLSANQWGQMLTGQGGDSAEPTDPSAASGDTTVPTIGNLLRWLINVLIAGFLIGLGGPFWYRVYSSLSNVAQVVRMFRGGKGRPEVLTDDSDALPATKAGIKEATNDLERGDLVSVFVTAAGPLPKTPITGASAPEGGQGPSSSKDTTAEPA